MANNREPYLDEEHLYNKYEAMKMANERNMKEKFEALDELEAIRLFVIGERHSVSTGICESITYGYGKLDDLGYWQYQLPQWFVNSHAFFQHKLKAHNEKG